MIIDESAMFNYLNCERNISVEQSNITQECVIFFHYLTKKILRPIFCFLTPPNDAK